MKAQLYTKWKDEEDFSNFETASEARFMLNLRMINQTTEAVVFRKQTKGLKPLTKEEALKLIAKVKVGFHEFKKTNTLVFKYEL